jgi:sigma-B regulation protein RsbU (phosphoserine phosphatase)
VFFQTPLAFAGAVGIKYFGLFKQYLVKLRMEDDLSVARDLQASMLPADCPEIEGYKIAARSTPAREVGGDFFDFINIGENKLGLVVADVTGKSVSGALVMSLSRSVFRMVSGNELSVGEIMIRANRQIKKDIKSGMFVALLYAVLDTQDRTLEMCSAGQTQPIHLLAETGEALLVETIGDTFPLGILESADYQGTRVQLSPGDKIVFYTDGIVEAMNKKEEMYGFERLLDVVQASHAMDADSLLTEIIGKVDTFAAGAEQHDDITVIVLGVAA